MERVSDQCTGRDWQFDAVGRGPKLDREAETEPVTGVLSITEHTTEVHLSAYVKGGDQLSTRVTMCCVMLSESSRLVWVAIAVVAHLIVVVLHGQAHTRLGVGLSNWQQLYVLAVIVLAPLVALALSFTRYARAGLWLLFASMLGSLIFGACYHYVIISSDHVDHLPFGEARGLFRVTAVLLLITEAFGVAVAALMLRRSLRAQVFTPEPSVTRRP